MAFFGVFPCRRVICVVTCSPAGGKSGCSSQVYNFPKVSRSSMHPPHNSSRLVPKCLFGCAKYKTKLFPQISLFPIRVSVLSVWVPFYAPTMHLKVQLKNEPVK